MDSRSNGRPPTAAAVPKSAVSAPLIAKGGEGPLRLSPKAGYPIILQKGKPVPCPTVVGKRGREKPGFTGLPASPGQGICPFPCRPFDCPSHLPTRGSCPPTCLTPFPLQKYIAQVLQDSEVDGDGDGGPGSSGDEPPSSSSQDEELLMPPDGLTDTDFQSCEDSLIENEIHQ